MSGIANLGRIAIDTARTMPSQRNTIIGGLAKGAEAHLNLKKMFDMYTAQLAWQEQYDMRKETREYGRQKELKTMENQAAMEKAIATNYGIKPVGYYTPNGQPINIPTVSREFPTNAVKINPLTTFPGYGIDTTGSSSTVPTETIPGWYEYQQGGKKKFLKKPTESETVSYHSDLSWAKEIYPTLSKKQQQELLADLKKAYPWKEEEINSYIY